MDWRRAFLSATGVVAAAYLALAVVPDYLVTTLSGRVAPVVRDLLVGVWTLAALAGVTWVLVRVQRREPRS